MGMKRMVTDGCAGIPNLSEEMQWNSTQMQSTVLNSSIHLKGLTWNCDGNMLFCKVGEKKKQHAKF